ncbi:hypothetical protein C0989_003087 [Termitomyces sp. Mn162]|nr:hypothetical protein C0989_003087 [Termitomyces sp. Mn162]
MTVISTSGCMAKQGLQSHLPTLPDNIFILHDCPAANELSGKLRQNDKIATRCFHAVMVARLLVFSCFLMTVRRRVSLSNQPLHLRKEWLKTLMKSWLFVQLDTRLLGDDQGHGDLLQELTCVLCTIVDALELAEIGGRLLMACNQAVLELDPKALLYCVVDEAQAAVGAWPKAFRDADTGCLNRPVLRAMIRPWLEKYQLRTIITGTSINRKLLVDALDSTVGKQADINDGVTSTGSWADYQTIQCFLAKYLPEPYLVTPSGVELIERARYWFWGRPRFISVYVQLVIQNGFRSFHRLLSRCVQAISHFVPLDGEYWEEQEPIITMDLPRLCPFDYERVSRIKYALMDSVQSITYERLMSGNLDFSATIKVTNYELVECGFARFPGSKIEDGKPLFDEPLAYLAADIWLNSQEDLCKKRYDYFSEQIGKHSSVGNGLERYTALVLAEAFRDFTQLSRVFDFANTGNNRGLAGRRARLVSCWRDSSGAFRVASSQYPIETRFSESFGHLELGPSSPSHLLGYKAPKGKGDYQEYEGNLQWLAGRHKAPFLFPMEQFGPDIMFRLKLEHTGEIITVALQVKQRARSLDFSAEADIKQAIRTVTPQYFWKDQLNGNAKGPNDLLERTVYALRYFPQRFNQQEARYDSVIRGLFVFPAECNRSTCERIKDVAVTLHKDPHDICIIPVQKLLELGGPIKRGLEFALKKAMQQSRLKEEEQLYDDWGVIIPGLQKADILPRLKTEFELEKLKSKDLTYQLLLHRRLEAIRHRCSGPVTYSTPHPKGLKRADRLSALKKALGRHNKIEESIHDRRRDY